MSEESQPPTQKFKTFQGVFRPTFLTILGALFYLREGWLVGSTGLVGALAVIVAAHIITGSTALSLASIATNTRVKAGGAFAMIANALGLEAGGAIAVPLYIAQAAGSAMYLYAFSEVWTYLFPTHNPLIVVTIAFLAVAGIAARSADLAFRAQAIMLVVVALALTSAFGAWGVNPGVRPTAFGAGSGVSLLTAFSIFFPAATGIMVGVGMSGSLESARRSIPIGTIGAWGVAFAVYFFGAILYATIATPEELIANKTILFDKALWGPMVIFGVLASTLMAAMSSLIAAPRLLQAMAELDVVPAARWLSKTTEAGDPRNASIVTSVLAALALASGSLDAIAPIITSFFLVTYMAVNGVVMLEQRLGMISFRPTFEIPRWLPLTGFIACLSALVLTSPGGGLVELLLVGGVYAWLNQRQLATPWETTRSGIGITVAASVARRFGQEERGERAWRPDLCVIVERAEALDRLTPIVRGMTHQSGSVILVGIGEAPNLADALAHYKDRLVDEGLYARWIHLHGLDSADPEREHATLHRLALDALQGALFPPNLVLVDGEGMSDASLQSLAATCKTQQRGLAVYHAPADAPILQPSMSLQVWVSDRSPTWQLGLRIANLDLPLLTGMLLSQWQTGKLRLSTAIANEDEADHAATFLNDLVEQGRLPKQTHRAVYTSPFADAIRADTPPDLTLLGLATDPTRDGLDALQRLANGPCLFLMDSGRESVLA